MGFRYRKSINLGGVRLNLSKSGIGMSVGGKGFRYSVNSKGRATTTYSIPGTGLSWSRSQSLAPSKKSSSGTSALSQVQIRQNQQAADEYEQYLQTIENLHQTSVKPADWNRIAQMPAPFTEGKPGPKEMAAREKLQDFRPNFLERAFGGNGDTRKAELEEKVSQARQEDLEDLEAWKSSHELAQAILEKDPQAYPFALDECGALQELSDYCTDFDFSIINAEEVSVEFDVHSREVIPAEERTLTKTGKLSVKQLTKTKYYDYLQDYVCSCAIRVARDLFAVLPVGTIIVSVEDVVLNTATGHDEPSCILSVQFERGQFEKTNFSRIDPSDLSNPLFIT